MVFFMAWTPQRREAYAKDQGAEASLVAVTARSNRSRADQDPAQWMPPATFTVRKAPRSRDGRGPGWFLHRHRCGAGRLWRARRLRG